MLRCNLASRSSLRTQNYIYSHLSLGVCVIFGCLACLWMLFLVSNAKRYPGFTELASLAKLYLITLVVGCLSNFRMPSLVSNAQTYPGFTEPASLAKLYLITLAVKFLSYFRMLSLPLDAILGFEC